MNISDLQDRIIELESAIRKHRDQRLDDKCWLDDQELYKILNDSNLGDNSVPSEEKMLENCKRFIKQRCNSNNKWPSYQEIEFELKNILGIIEAHECTCFSCDGDREEYCDCLKRATKHAKEILK